MNVILISGNLGKDAELRKLQDGTSVVNFSVADSQGKDKPAIWWNCALFGKRADALLQYLVKGQTVTVNGPVSEREYTDKDGNQRKSMDVRVNDVALQGGKRDADQQPTTPAPRPQSGATPTNQAEPKGSAGSGFDDMDDDIPF